jgi:hypothetical protein
MGYTVKGNQLLQILHDELIAGKMHKKVLHDWRINFSGCTRHLPVSSSLWFPMQAKDKADFNMCVATA